MIIEKSSGVGGSWLDKKNVKTGDYAKLKSEAEWVDGQNGKQLIAKIRIKGTQVDVNLAINSPSKDALIDAYGSDSKEWIDKLLTVQVEPGIFAGKRGIMLNLIPEGYVVGEDAAGYIIIRPKVEAPKVVKDVLSAKEIEEGIDVSDLPF